MLLRELQHGTCLISVIWIRQILLLIGMDCCWQQMLGVVVFIESDITFVVQAVVQDEAYQGPELPISTQCKHLASKFAKTFGHCFIEANEGANSHAKIVLLQDG